MAAIDGLLAALNEYRIAQEVGLPHDEVRLAYRLRSNTAGTFDEFSDIIGDYYNHHFTRCISRGGSLPKSEATSRAKEILERRYERLSGGNLNTAYYDARDGTNGGLRIQLDMIAETLKQESVERYIREVFDRHVAPCSFEDKVEIVRQFIDRCGADLAPSLDHERPERYAHEYQELIRNYVAWLQRTSSIFRRL